MKSSLRLKIVERMQELNVEPKRSLGQNFLVSENVVEKIMAAADPATFVHSFEIGPGLGALTDALAERTKALSLIELDQSFAQYWLAKGFRVYEDDALRFDWSQIDWNQGPALLVSNLPYQISSRLVVNLSLMDKSFTRMVLMFQKEVAQRITARPATSDYGLLTVIAQSFWRPRLVVEAGAVDFLPKPNVASRVICFDRKARSPELEDSLGFLEFVKKAFASRRKKLLPKLVSYKAKPQLLEIFAKLSLEEDVRAEKLDPGQFVALYLALKKRY